MRPGARGIALAAGVALAAWLAWPGDAATPVAAGTRVALADAQRAPPAPAPAQGASMAFFSAPGSAPVVPASVSMANTRLHGDPEAPPIARSEEAPVLPTAAELADPKAYLAFEARQNLRLYSAYVRAVDQQVPILSDDIARGVAIGIAPEKIAKAQEKVRRLQAMRAQLIKDHPELGP